MTKHEKLINHFKKLLRIESWDITLHIMTEDDYQKKHGKDFSYDTDGCTEIDDVHSQATIYIKDTLTGDRLINTLLHECIHLVTHRYDSFVRDTLTHVDSKKIAKVFKNDALWEMEIQVCKLTTIIQNLIKEK